MSLDIVAWYLCERTWVQRWSAVGTGGAPECACGGGYLEHGVSQVGQMRPGGHTVQTIPVFPVKSLGFLQVTSCSGVAGYWAVPFLIVNISTALHMAASVCLATSSA